VLKVDVALTHGIDHDPNRAALASLFVSFAAHMGASVVAEGVESEAERITLTALGVQFGQGFLLGAPGDSVDRTPSPARDTAASLGLTSRAEISRRYVR
jgi:EAL domain-containing protein (putative c-di-GMP-specific phosphodiesterase class I)